MAAAAAELGLALYRFRLSRGLSLRVLARRLGMSGHGGLTEYEKGRRIPPEDVVLACERVLGVRDGQLLRLRDRALAERAAFKVADLRGALTLAPAAPAAQLPSDTADFAGRAAEVSELRARSGGIVVISGMPGVGKTALGVHVAHLLAAEYPDAQLYCDLHGARDPADPADALAGMIWALGVADSQLPHRLDDRIGLYRSLLHSRRVVLMLDNATDEGQVRPLLPGGPHCLTLITSRSRLAGLSGVHRLVLDVPELDDAVQLLAGIVGRERTDVESEAAREIARACGRLPLALRIAGHRLVAWPGWRLTQLAAQLADERNRLAWFRAGDLDIRDVFAMAYETVGSDGQWLFERLSLVPGEDFGPEIAGVLAEAAIPVAEHMLDRLAAAGLIEPAPPAGRYRLHYLLRLYARERLGAETVTGSAAAARMTDYLLETSMQAASALAPPTQGESSPGGRFADDRASALDWLDAEVSNVLGAARLAPEERVGELLRHLVWYLDLRCGWQGLRELSELARAAAPDLAAAAFAWNCLGRAFAGTCEFGPAARCHERAADLARSAADRREEGSAHDHLGVALCGLGRYTEAIEHHERGVQICRKLGDRWGEAAGLNYLGRALRQLARQAEAEDCHRAALGLFAELGDVRGEAMATNALGSVLSDAGQFAEARARHERALAALSVMGDERAMGMTRHGLGVALHGLGRPGAAAEEIRRAHTRFRQVGDRLWEAHALTGLGRALTSLGDHAQAQACWRQSLARYTELGTPEASDIRRLLGELADGPS